MYVCVIWEGGERGGVEGVVFMCFFFVHQRGHENYF